MSGSFCGPLLRNAQNSKTTNERGAQVAHGSWILMKSPISPRRDGTSFVYIHSPFSLSLFYSPPDLRSLRATRYSPRGFPPSFRNYSTNPRRASSKLHLQSYWSINGILIVSNRIVYPSKKERIDNNNKTKTKFGKLEIFLDSREKERVDNRVMG